VQPLPGTDRIDALVGPPSLEPAQALLRTAAGRLAGMLDDVEADVLIDAGRLPAAPLAGRCSRGRTGWCWWCGRGWRS
jgi:hypothetical protein